MGDGWHLLSPDHPQEDEATVFFPGWGFDGHVLRLVTPRPRWWTPEAPLDPACMDEYFSFLCSLPEKIHLIGWSMGAAFALHFAKRHPERTASITLLGVRKSWPSQEITLARSKMETDWQQFVHDIHRRSLAGFPRSYEKFKAAQQQHLLKHSNKKIFIRGLDLLAAPLPQPLDTIPTLSLHGRRDQVAPVDDMAHFPWGKTVILPRSGHFPLLDPSCPLHQHTKKQAVFRSFSRAAASYDDYALVQRQAGEMLDRLFHQQGIDSLTNILEIGCGTGFFTQKLSARFPDASISSLDFSPDMIAESRKNLATNNHVRLLCEDGELFLKKAHTNSFDCITSVGAMQWFADLPTALAHAVRALTPEGHLFLALFGPGSLTELAHGLTAVFGTHVTLPVQGFLAASDIGRILAQHLPATTIETKRVHRQYPDPRTLLAHIKNTGTAGAASSQPLVFTRSRLKALEEWFQKHHNGCRVSYELIMLHGKRYA